MVVQHGSQHCSIVYHDDCERAEQTTTYFRSNSTVFFIFFENLNLFLNYLSLKLVLTVRTKFSDHRDEFPITRKLKTRFCDRAGDKKWPK